MLLGHAIGMMNGGGGGDPTPPTPPAPPTPPTPPTPPVVLPYDAEVEYLETTGTQWVDTGVNPGEATEYEIEGEWADFGILSGIGFVKHNPLFSAFMRDPSYGDLIISLAGYSSSGQLLLIGLELTDADYTTRGSAVWFSELPVTGVFYKIRMTCSNARDFYYYKDSSQIGNDSYYNAQPSTNTIRLLSHSGGASPYYGIAKTRTFKITIEGVLVRDFISVRIGTTGYFYDKANPTGGPLGNGLYPNSGPGDFVLGPDKT